MPSIRKAFQKPLTGPPRPQPPQITITLKNALGQPVYLTEEKWDERRQDVLRRRGKVLNWERPPQRTLDSGTRVLSNGQVLHC